MAYHQKLLTWRQTDRTFFASSHFMKSTAYVRQELRLEDRRILLVLLSSVFVQCCSQYGCVLVEGYVIPKLLWVT